MITHYQTILSTARFNTYRLTATSDEEALARYFWNLELSSALLPTIALLEVALRNRIDFAFSRVEPDWLGLQWTGWSNYRFRPFPGAAPIKGNPERELLKQALVQWANRRDAMIANFSLGFWVGLFKGHYKTHMWSKKRVVQDVFPNLALKSPDIISVLSGKLWWYKQLRNRICHHEPVFNWPGSFKVGHANLKDAHTDLIELIGWLSVDIRETIEQTDRFPTVWKAGF